MRMVAALATLAAALTAGLPGAPAQASPAPPVGENVSLVTTNGAATFKLCRNWVFTHTCREYGNVAVPARIAPGDSFEITFGSNPKTIWFRVKSVLLQDGRCLLIPRHEDMPANGEDEPVDMLIVDPCRVLR
ncbi:hypothetical protein [Roseomonas genomospecies 6]|uniref:Uncharacterized protein n=1 Tax=Roseomonas genomospecies 6 TaxID=214106 RepID=A0A9W7NDS2_9PROT|nr:hypothetical protein [Roseomonas genomospecies 6]KAA0675795.1 hypothetical protein DS843_29905 [Roseomonas genomospecies 6]